MTNRFSLLAARPPVQPSLFKFEAPRNSMRSSLQVQKSSTLKTFVFWMIFLLISFLVLIPVLSGSDLNIPYKFFAVESGSMRPEIKEGDLIVVKTQNEEYKIGDVITFRFKGTEVKANNTHRIVDIHTTEEGTKEYITKGDFNSVIDVDRVTDDRIVGKYLFGIPLIGYPVRFVQTVPGLILLIVIPSTILIYEEIQNIKRELNKRKFVRRENNTYQK